MAMPVNKNTYGSTKSILKLLTPWTGIDVMLTDDDVEPNELGRKIVPAGTILGGGDRSTVSVHNGEEAQGVLFKDTDVTNGSAPATMLIFGFVALDKIPEEPTEEALASRNLSMVQFL